MTTNKEMTREEYENLAKGACLALIIIVLLYLYVYICYTW